VAILCIAGASSSFAELASNRYALILEDPPVASQFQSREAVQSAAAKSYHQQILARQRTVRSELSARNIQVTGSVDTLQNAIFVVATPERAAELKNVPGVKAVVPLRRYHRNLNRAAPLVNAPAAWNTLGGTQSSGTGIKIAILDSGIDQTHPAFQDKSLPIPAGFPICNGTDCSFTNNKVIVARSYVRQLAMGTAPNPAADSRPDDYSPRDRDGHGTAVASCAAAITNTGAVTFSGIAPKAYLGNYKIYGSPEVNDSTTDDVIMQALEDALNDGMDIVSFSTGGPAFTGPLDTGTACGNAAGVPCDLIGQAFDKAAKAGITIIAATGNSGQDGNSYPTLDSASSPADAPSVIAVGATTNSHFFLETIDVPGSSVPSNLQKISGQTGDAYVPHGSIAAPLRDVTSLGNDGLACTALPAGSLTGAIALIMRGTCSFAVKVSNAEDAGAQGVIFYMADQSATVSPGGLASSFVPAINISNSDGVALKTFINANPEHPVTFDPTGTEQDAQSFNQLAGFSSFGPSTGNYGVKPEIVAPGTTMYMAVESYDPLGILYSSDGYGVADGTSFSTPLVAGAAALVKQSHPGLSTAQIKSALVNTASQDVKTDDSGNPVTIEGVGAGKLDASAAINATVFSDPATVSFGKLTSGSLPATQQLQITNGGTGAVVLAIAIVPATTSAQPQLTLDKQSLSLAAGASGSVTLTLTGSIPAAGFYSGVITIQSQGVSLRVPYQYFVGSGVAANMIPLTGSGFDGTVGQGIPDGFISFKLVDAYGVPVSGAPVSFTSRGGGTLQNADTVTDTYGVAGAQPVLGSQPGTYSYTAVAGGMRVNFSGNARLQPAITAGGIANAASAASAAPVAPGSYISIFGSNLSDFTDSASSANLPLAIDLVNVSFDVPSAGISVPGHLIYVSSNQVNVQVPWELQGQSSAQVKVTIDYTYGNVVTLPLSNFAPAFFEASAGAVAALDGTNKPITSANPALRGQVVQLFANGLGPVSNQPASGEPAGSSPLAQTTNPATVMIGGQTANVLFSGLAPGFAGLYQINAVVPAGITPGTSTITVSIGGATSKASGIPVQ
jgi:minor extracellular serine protease Vpr